MRETRYCKVDCSTLNYCKLRSNINDIDNKKVYLYKIRYVKKEKKRQKKKIRETK